MPRKSAPNERTNRARFEIDRRPLWAAEAQIVGPAQDVVAEDLEGEGRGRAVPREELGDERAAMALPRPRQERERVLGAVGGQLVELRQELRDRIVPGNRLELPGAARAGALQRLAEPIGMVGDLDARLAARAQAALADWMRGVPFQLLRHRHRHHAGLAVLGDVDLRGHHAGLDAAARLADRADAGLPVGHPRRDLVRRQEADQGVLGVAAARQPGAGAGHRRELDESPAIHQRPPHPARAPGTRWQAPGTIPFISSGMSCSRWARWSCDGSPRRSPSCGPRPAGPRSCP